VELRERLVTPRSGLLDLKMLLEQPEEVQRLARWFIQLRILPQFTLAEELLYGDGDGSSEAWVG
jgi:hypothetical protein